MKKLLLTCLLSTALVHAAAKMPPIDAATEANNLANLFYGLSQALDDFRLNAPADTPPAQLAQLKAQAQALTDQAHHFTGQAIGATLASIQNDLADIKATTAAVIQIIGSGFPAAYTAPLESIPNAVAVEK
jgi:hypothetical protein